MNSQIEYHMPYDSHGKIQIASPFFLLLVFGTLLGQGLLGFVLVTIESNVNSGLESTTVSTNVDPTTMTTINHVTQHSSQKTEDDNRNDQQLPQQYEESKIYIYEARYLFYG